MSIPAVSYYRRSTDRQEQSIGDQRKAVEAYAADHEMTIIREYVDDGISGAATAKRESFLRMIEESAAGDFALVLVYDISRFARTDTDEVGHYRYLLRQNGVEVVYCMDNLGTGDEQDLVRGVLQWQKHKFLIDLSRDIARGMVTTAEGGWQAGGRAPYGFKRALLDEHGKVVKVLEQGETKMSDKQKVTLVLGDPREVAAVKRIFGKFRGGWGYRAIAQDLNNNGVPSPKGNGWATSTIRDMLPNHHYVGDAVWNQRPKGKFYEVCEGRPARKRSGPGHKVRRNAPAEWIVSRDAHEAIVSREEFEDVQRRIRGARRNSGYKAKSRPSRYSLSGLVFCCCGNPMWGHSIPRRLRDGGVRRHRYYSCSGGLSGRLPDHRITVPADQLESFVVRRLCQAYEDTDLQADVRQMLRVCRAAERSDTRGEITAVRKEIGSIDRALENVSRRVLMTTDDELARAMMREAETLRRRRPVLMAKLDELAADEEPEPCEVEAEVEKTLRNIGKLEDTFAAASSEGRRAFLQSVLTTVEGQPGPVVLDFSRVKTGQRAEVTFHGGRFWAIPIAALEFDGALGVRVCRRRESNPHGLAATGF